MSFAMDIPKEIYDLADFYKYCMNTVLGMRKNGMININTVNYKYNDTINCTKDHETAIEWHGWTRCSITPYLINNKVIDSESLIKNLKCSLMDYWGYSNFYTSGRSDESKVKKLIKFVNDTKTNLIDMIEYNAHLFPNETDKDHANILIEHWDDYMYVANLENKIENYIGMIMAMETEIEEEIDDETDDDEQK